MNAISVKSDSASLEDRMLCVIRKDPNQLLVHYAHALVITLKLALSAVELLIARGDVIRSSFTEKLKPAAIELEPAKPTAPAIVETVLTVVAPFLPDDTPIFTEGFRSATSDDAIAEKVSNTELLRGELRKGGTFTSRQLSHLTKLDVSKVTALLANDVTAGRVSKSKEEGRCSFEWNADFEAPARNSLKEEIKRLEAMLQESTQQRESTVRALQQMRTDLQGFERKVEHELSRLDVQ